MKCILIIDDDAKMRDALKQYFDEGGYRVIEASNGKNALTLLQNDRPDLVITDIFMAEMDGVEVIMNIREKYPDIRIIAMSGGSTISAPDCLDAASDLGAADIFHKPFALKDMMRSVKALID